MADIFISYSSKDKAKAQKLYERLTLAGYSCWIDESGINTAMQWSAEIVRAISECKVFIILLSHNALESHNVVKELSLASEEKKYLIPVFLELVELSNEVKYQLAGLQHVDYKEYGRIENAVGRILNDSVFQAVFLPKKFHHHLRRNIIVSLGILLLIATAYFFIFRDRHITTEKDVINTLQITSIPLMSLTADSIAVQLYGQALYIFKKGGTKQELRHAMNLLDSAERRDPHFTEAFYLEQTINDSLGTYTKNQIIRIRNYYASEPKN